MISDLDLINNKRFIYTFPLFFAETILSNLIYFWFLILVKMLKPIKPKIIYKIILLKNVNKSVEKQIKF